MSFVPSTTTLDLTPISTTKHPHKFGKVSATTQNQNDGENPKTEPVMVQAFDGLMTGVYEPPPN
jgi:hypothetical protein